jgi:hypothetical protein
MKGNYIPADTGQIALAAAANDREVHTITIDATASDGNIITFDGLVTKFQPGNSSNTETFSATIEVTGEPTITTTYAALTALTLATTTAQIPTPFGASYTTYLATAATGTSSITVTPTVAAVGKMYLNGTVVTTTGTISLGSANSVTRAVLKVVETGKATQFIHIYVGRV